MPARDLRCSLHSLLSFHSYVCRIVKPNPLRTPPLAHRQFSLTENYRLLLRRLPTVSIPHLLMPLLPMFSPHVLSATERFSQAPCPSNRPVFYPTNPYRFSYWRPLFPHPVSISPPLSLFPLALKSLFLTSTPPLSRALHSSSSCQTLIHSPRALTKHSSAVSSPHQALATATLPFLSTPPPLPATPPSILLVP